MRFVDSATITVKAGDGGSGIASFRREKNIARGGPDGGDGGNGGDVILQGDRKLHSLLDYRYGSLYKATKGGSGGKSNRHGKKAPNLCLPVPCGTLVFNAENGEQIGEIIRDGQKLEVALGGEGGFGNVHYKSSTRRAPYKSTPGGTGDLRKLNLELRILADVGLVGLPNAGKSSFLKASTRANPKIANYPFTTLDPNKGVFFESSDNFEEAELVLADIPGIVEGAADGKGLGLQFLKHVERTHLLLHLVDLTAADPLEDMRIFEKELEQHSEGLRNRERWILGNKIDLLTAKQRHNKKKMFESCGIKVRMISTLTGEGVNEVCRQAVAFLKDIQK